MGTLSGIYMIQNIESKKCYIGYSTNIRRRWDNHKFKLRNNKHTNQHLQSAWNKYGEETFIFSVIKNMSIGLCKEEYEKEETKWVLHFNSHKTKYGYNACLPGSIPLERQKQINMCNIGVKNSKRNIPCICINKKTEEIIEKSSYKEVSELTEIPLNKVTEYCSYWINLSGRKKSHKGWIVIKKELYNPDFDYISYNSRIKK